MIKNNIPFFSELVKALKTRKSIIQGQELYVLEDWEVIKRGYLPSKMLALTLVVASSLPAWILSKILFSTVSNISDDFKREFASVRENVDSFLVPLVIYFSVFFGVKYIYIKSERVADKVIEAQKYFLYELYSKFFWPMVFLNSMAVVLASILNRWSLIGEYIWEMNDSIKIPILSVAILSVAIPFIYFLYLQYYKIPKTYLSLNNIEHDAKYLVIFGLKYWASTAYALFSLSVLSIIFSFIYAFMQVGGGIQ